MVSWVYTLIKGEKLKHFTKAILMTFSLVLMTSASSPASAQTYQDDTEQAPRDIAEDSLSELVLDEVEIISGNPFWQRGIQAFNVGDYVRAQKHFTTFKNSLAPSVLLDPFTTGGANGLFFNANGFLLTNSGLEVNKNINRSGLPTRIGRRPSNSEIGIQAARNGYSFASYWLGMAQVRQGNLAGAKRSMMEAIRYDKAFHDARMRVGLLNLLEDKPKLAKRRLHQIGGYCGGECTGSDKIGASYQRLKIAIEAYEKSES